MLAYAARRLAAIPPTLFIIVTLAFVVVRAAPGGPFDAEQSLPPQVKANLERAYGLDQPLLVQYVRYLRAIVHGDFGPSLKYRDLSVGALIAQGLPVSLLSLVKVTAEPVYRRCLIECLGLASPVADGAVDVQGFLQRLGCARVVTGLPPHYPRAGQGIGLTEPVADAAVGVQGFLQRLGCAEIVPGRPPDFS